MPSEGTNEPAMAEQDFGGSKGRATHIESPNDQRVTEGCSNSQKIAEIQGAEVVGDQRITKKQKKVEDGHKKVSVVKWVDE